MPNPVQPNVFMAVAVDTPDRSAPASHPGMHALGQLLLRRGARAHARTDILPGEVLKCHLESILTRARVWLYAGNHVEPEEEIRNRAYFHARDSDLP